jgi:hypothetical protein
VHDRSGLERGVGVEEAVGRDQVDARVIRPAAEERAQHAGGGRLAGGDAAGDGDDVRHPGRERAEEAGRDPVQLLDGGDVQVQEPRQREIDVRHLVDG